MPPLDAPPLDAHCDASDQAFPCVVCLAAPVLISNDGDDNHRLRRDVVAPIPTEELPPDISLPEPR